MLDGAYAEYVIKDDYDSGFSLTEEFENIIMTRTFSKVYGLAALRIGWCYSSEKVANILKKVKGPFNTQTISQEIAMLALDDKEYLKEVVNNKKVSKNNKKIKYTKNVKWVRPHNGKVSKEFSYSDVGKKGIDISGVLGDNIYSTGDGMVVYTGNGIKGYGNLIIIKHNETFLSAYAHTSKILVEENNIVKKGQIIANLGDTDSIKPILHFQIRKNGKPVDPEKYLP